MYDLHCFVLGQRIFRLCLCSSSFDVFLLSHYVLSILSLFFFPIFWIEFLFSFLLFLIPSATSYCSFGSNSLQLFLEITQRTCLQCRRSKFDPWVGTIPWRREWQPTSVFLPREYHGQKSLVGNSPRGPKESDTTEQLTHPHVNMLT